MNTFGIGNVLATGFRVWFRNLVPFLMITALFYAPLWIWTIVVMQGSSVRVSLSMVLLSGSLFPLLIDFLVSATLTYGVVMELQGRRASMGTCITAGLARFFPALGVGLLGGLCIGVASLALLIPGLIVYSMLYVAVPASVIERPGIGGALSRSSELTRGRKLQIFGLIVLIGLISFGLSTLLNMVLLPVVAGGSRTGVLAWTSYLRLFDQMITGSISATMASVAYYHLRAEKEGVSVTELAAVFD